MGNFITTFVVVKIAKRWAITAYGSRGRARTSKAHKYWANLKSFYLGPFGNQDYSSTISAKPHVRGHEHFSGAFSGSDCMRAPALASSVQFRNLESLVRLHELAAFKNEAVETHLRRQVRRGWRFRQGNDKVECCFPIVGESRFILRPRTVRTLAFQVTFSII